MSAGTGVAQTKQEIEDAAEELGLTCMFPLDSEVQIDLDEDAVLQENVLRALCRNGLQMLLKLETTSKSGNKHVYIRFNRALSQIERTAIQAVLGSDLMREALAIVRIFAGCDPCSAMFETEAGVKAVEKWRKK